MRFLQWHTEYSSQKSRFGIIFKNLLAAIKKMYVHLNRFDVDFWIVYFEDLFFYTLVVQLPLNSRLIDLIDLIVTISIIETEYLLNPGPASPYIVLTVTDHTNLMLSVFHPPTYHTSVFWLKYPLINCINANF